MKLKNSGGTYSDILVSYNSWQMKLKNSGVAPANRLKIGKSNLRLSSNLISKEPTLQVVLDALKLTPFYKAFEITADVPDIHMQEFWVTVSCHHSSLRFKLNGKSHTINVDNFRDMLKISPKLKKPHLKRRFYLLLETLDTLTVDYVYLLWEDLVYQVENKNSKKNNDMYYSRFTKVIVDYFMANDQAIPRRNKMFWHYARDDFMFTTIRVISKHQDTQVYGAILPQHLTNQTMLELEAYKTYLAYAIGEKIPKSKYVKNKADSESSPKKKTVATTKGKRLKTSAKAAKPAKKKQPAKTSKAKGLTVLSEVALTEAKQIKLATKRSLIETHSSHASGLGADKGTGSKPGVPDVPTYGSDDEQISWKSSDEEDDDDDNDADDQDDDDQEDDDQEVRHNKEESNEESDEESDEEIQGANTNVQTTQVMEDTHVVITPVNPEGQQQSSSVSSGFVSNMLNLSPDTCIDSIFNLNTESTSLIDVPVTITLLPPPTPLITHLQQTPVPTPATVPSSSLQDLPNFGSLFGFDHRLKTLENNFSEFKQTNQFAATVSSIPGIVDTYLANKMNEAVKTAVQLQSDRLRDEAQAENEDFLNKLDDNIKKIIKDQVKEQTRWRAISQSTDLMNRRISTKHWLTLTKVTSSFDTYGDNVSFKRRRDDEDKDEEPSSRSNQGSKVKSHHKSAGESAQAKEPRHTTKDLEEPAHLEFKTGVTKDQPDEETSQLPDYDDKLYKFKEGDFNRLHIQDIEYMLLLLGSRKKLEQNLTVEEHLAFNVSLRMFTRSVVIQRRVEDLQLGVESYQKKLNLTKPDTYRSDLKRREAYTAYSNPRGFIYQNKDKKNRLMRIDELYKFSDGTLNDVRTALDDRLKGIRMKYLPQTIWRQSDRDKAGAMIQAIDKQLKTRRIMRSLEKFVGGRPSILVDPHSFEGSNKDGNGDFRYSDTVRPSRSDEVLKLKNFEKDVSLQLSSYQIKKGIHMEPNKIDAVKNWKAPSTPLEDKNFDWGEEQEKAFQTLKDALYSASILTLPDGPDNFVVYYDASRQGLRCVLMQRSKKLKAPKEAFKDDNVQFVALREVDKQMERKEDDAMYFVVRIWVPLGGNIRTLVMDEAYKSRYSIHPGADKMYHDLKDSIDIDPYLQHEHYALWEVIEFGDSYKAPPEETGKGVTGEGSAKKKGKTMAITTEDMQKRRNDVKARTTLLLALPDEHQLRFSKYDNAKELWEAILKTFGSEILKQTFNRLQAIVSHLEFMDVPIEQDDLNKKFLSSLAPEWVIYTIVWRNRDDLDTMSLDDVYNHLKVYKPEVQKRVSTSGVQVSTATTDVATASLSHDTKTGKKITIQGSDVAGFDKSKVECFNCHKMGHFARECRAPSSQDKGRKESYKKGPKIEEPTPKAMIAIDGIGWD
ncbi:integrase, catalytic region, zinc finger, CCHC-type containing protein [Tanacetum coccineum]